MNIEPRRKSLGLAGLLGCALLAGRPAAGADWSVTVLPSASVRYRGEGKVLPESYVNRFEGHISPLYRIEVRQDPSPDGYWELALWHTGVFGGGAFGRESVPDMVNGGNYQDNRLNVG